MNTAALVKDILIDVLQLSSDIEMDEETALLGAIPEFDSMAVVSVLTAVEETFGIEIPEDQAESIQTVGQAIEFIESKQNG